ncbi:hypothetical protein Hamer_G018859 [Homarus americanus]|uniref:Uncharacterized protein n=1 Tax=Homarus americanus TaxID=6706 RepID=A0A8J5MZD1_HOMAM|nr:hypothetical protein Hamer_G018859 [Homarus americanus]
MTAAEKVKKTVATINMESPMPNVPTQTDSFVELQQIEAELSDSDQTLPAPDNQEEMVDDLTLSTSHTPSCNHEVLSVCEFLKKYNIKNAMNRIVKAWCKINIEQIEACRERQFVVATLVDIVKAAQSDPAPGFLDVQVEDLQEIIGQRQQQPTTEEMLEEDKDQQEKQQPTGTRIRYQAIITWYLNKAQPVNTLANITLDDDGTTGDDTEVLGDLLVLKLEEM